MNSEKCILEIKNLKKYYKVNTGLFSSKTLKAVDGINLEIKEGEVLGIIGESGCGKSTLCKIIVQLLKQTEGSIYFMKEEIKETNKFNIRNNIHLIFQNQYASLDPSMTIQEILSEALKNQNKLLSKIDIQYELKKIIELLELPINILGKYANELSGGQIQRVCIARALALKPKVLIFDEALSSLDIYTQIQMINLLKYIKNEYNLTYLFISHNIEITKYISDRIAVMYLGQIIEIGSSREIYDNPIHPYTSGLISAIPSTYKKNNKTVIRGEITSLDKVGTGCKFCERCNFSNENCKKMQPNLQKIENDHYVACIKKL